MPADIRSVANGYIINLYGEEHIAASLLDAAEIVGEYVPSDKNTTYAAGMDSRNLAAVREEAIRGNKINAIRLLRNCFTPTLGLRESKELIEQLCNI